MGYQYLYYWDIIYNYETCLNHSVVLQIPFKSFSFQRCYSSAMPLYCFNLKMLLKTWKCVSKAFALWENTKFTRFNPHIIKIKYVQEDGLILYELVCSRHLIWDFVYFSSISRIKQIYYINVIKSKCLKQINLQKTGFLSLFLGMLISLVFGFIFGLILGSTEMPWGFTDWPTEEMKGR